VACCGAWACEAGVTFYPVGGDEVFLAYDGGYSEAVGVDLGYVGYSLVWVEVWGYDCATSGSVGDACAG